MIPERLLTRSLTWIEPTISADRYGDAAEAWGAGTAITGRIDTLSQLEVQDQTRDMATTVRVLFTNTTGLTSKARIVDGTTTYEVDGLPAVIDSPAGPHHTEARLRLIGG
jgi:head-tail adaptor